MRAFGNGLWAWGLFGVVIQLSGCSSASVGAPVAAEHTDGGGAGGEPAAGPSLPGLDAPGSKDKPGPLPAAVEPVGGMTGNGEPGAGTVAARSFDVSGHVRLVDDPNEDPSLWEGCLAFDFTGRFVEQQGKWSFVAAVGGGFASADVHATAGGAYDIEPVTEWPDASLIMPAGDCGSLLYLMKLSFRPGPADAAGNFTDFVALGSGLIESEGGDVLYSADVDVQLVGKPDATPPRLTLPSVALHPLEASVVRASEALDASTVATLTPQGGAAIELVHSPSAKAGDLAFWSFNVPPLLALGQRYTLRANGSDAAGNALSAKGVLQTAADPGLQAQDGFESELLALSERPLKLVSKGALAGNQSLLIDDGDKVTFHLATQGGKVLHFDARNLIFDDGGSQGETEPVRVTLGVVGGTSVVSKDFTTQRLPSGSHVGEPAAFAMEVPLPEDGDELLVSFQIAPFYEADCGLISCDAIPALIDNLRVE